MSIIGVKGIIEGHLLVVLPFLDRFERALKSARETLKRAREGFQSTAIAAEQKELFGYGDRSSKYSKRKKKARPPWTKQFYCLAYCNQDHVPVTEEELDKLFHTGLGLKKITVPDMNTLSNSHFRGIILENFPSLREGERVCTIKGLSVFGETSSQVVYTISTRYSVT